MSGWIKRYRSIKDHWIYENNRPRTKNEAWEDILMTVNFEPKKVLIKGQLIDCGIGQSLNSLNSWAYLFKWSVQQVRTFFKLLEDDNMITLEGMQYTTRLTVCNYERYQSTATDEQHTEQQTNNTPATCKNCVFYEFEKKSCSKFIDKLTQLNDCILNDYEFHQHTDNTPITDQQQTANILRTSTKELKNKKNIINGRKNFIKPTLKQIEEYVKEQNLKIDPVEFYNSNETKGWVVGKFQTPMKNWKTACHTWDHNSKKETEEKQSTQNKKAAPEPHYESLDDYKYDNEV